MKEQFREEIMKLVGRRFGKGYNVTRRDTEGRNGHTRHEICIYKTGEAQPVAVCLEDAILRCIEEGLPPGELPDGIVQMYLQEEVSRHISMGLYGPAALEGMVRERLGFCGVMQYERMRDRCRKITAGLQEKTGYDRAAAIEKCRRRAKRSRKADDGVGEDALVLAARRRGAAQEAAKQSADAAQEAAQQTEDAAGENKAVQT